MSEAPSLPEKPQALPRVKYRSLWFRLSALIWRTHRCHLVASSRQRGKSIRNRTGTQAVGLTPQKLLTRRDDVAIELGKTAAEAPLAGCSPALRCKPKTYAVRACVGAMIWSNGRFRREEA